ncbi:683_t:CDS:1, partial [Dentiscutata heterogama]
SRSRFCRDQGQFRYGQGQGFASQDFTMIKVKFRCVQSQGFTMFRAK